MVNNGQLQRQQREVKLTVRGDKDNVVREGTSVLMSQLNLFKSHQMEQLRFLLNLSGHNNENGPQPSKSVLAVLDTDIATWPIDRLREAHRKHHIHIVPANPFKSMDFDEGTFEALGINMDQPRQAHCKSFIII